MAAKKPAAPKTILVTQDYYGSPQALSAHANEATAMTAIRNVAKNNHQAKATYRMWRLDKEVVVETVAKTTVRDAKTKTEESTISED